MPNEKYDYIIIGGGSAGSVLANRFSKDPSNKVLVIEAGRPDHGWDFRIHMPAALTYPLTNNFYNWGYESDPEPHMNNRRVYQPRGKVLGGSSVINGMIFIRGNAMDYQKWANEKGLENWSYEHCLPYFKRLENRLIGGDTYRGNEGPLYLTTPKCDNPLFKAFFESVQEAGYPLTDDVNGYQQEGFGKFDATIYKGKRWNAARAYIHPIKNRKNLTIHLKSTVSKILFEGKTAIGIDYIKNGKNEKAFGGQIICCGGAINTPQVLQLSGIGNADELKKLGIPVVADLKGVGENLQDHLEVYVQWAAKKPVSLYPSLKFYNQPKIGLEWLFNKTGVGASNHFEAGGFIRGNDEVTYPNLQYHFLPIAIRYDGSAPNEGHGFQLHVGPMNTDVKGHVKIKSADPSQYPSILFNYLSTNQEKKEWIEAIRCTRNLINQPAFDELRGKELSPGSAVETDEEILDFVAREGESAYHPSCTCKMGYDDMSVVDANLKVHGINNLSVVDASVMPHITNGNIYAPVLMIAEKAADILLGNSPEAPLKVPFYKHNPESKKKQFSN
jgi:choline dehydrogenase